jgi:hypothetical protein
MSRALRSRSLTTSIAWSRECNTYWASRSCWAA